MADKITVASLFTNVANAIRAKTGRSEKIIADEFPFALTSIPNNDVFLSIINKSVIDIPNSYLENLTKIGGKAFCYCRNLALTSLPESLTYIDDWAFYGCTNLALTSLPEELTSIGYGAFGYCHNLTLTSLPAGLDNIGGSAFDSCIGLKSLTFKGTPTMIDSHAFRNCSNLTTINAPWAEGEVAGAPWGATNATINYNYTGE